MFNKVSRAYDYKHVLQQGEDCHGNQKHIDFCLSKDIRVLGILWIYNLSVNLISQKLLGDFFAKFS